MILMETKSDRRLRKLQELCNTYTLAKVAERSKISPVYIDQILKRRLLPAKADGSRSPRNLGDAKAHAIEDAFTLGRGWFDSDADDIPMTPDELKLLAHYRELSADLQRLFLEGAQNAVEDQRKAAEHFRKSISLDISQTGHKRGEKIPPAGHKGA